MDFRKLFDFLHRLNNHNNKDWMDEHRKEYQSLRDDYLHWLEQLEIKFAQVDPDYTTTGAKKALNRINNNLLFHPNKPIYKDHFGAGLDKKPGASDFYIHLGINESFIAGGFYKPKKEHLDSIRAAIDYDGEELEKILQKPSFQKTFGEMLEIDPLKTSPKAYASDHRFIHYLRRRSFVVSRDLTEKEIFSADFQQKLVKYYLEILPFRQYLNHAVSV
ncbi:MAG: DUF2461 domain-containing protein [Bacteroidota bacterium]|nr:DUF2461 domain-containing protein [Bacteroidota bacterium]